MSFWDRLGGLKTAWDRLGGDGSSSGWRGVFGGMPEQLTRLLVVAVLFVGTVLFVRIFLVPPALKETGFQRTSTIEREAARPIKYAGSALCSECHDEQPRALSASMHRNLSCESCHGPALAHTEDPFEAKPPAPRERRYCPQCHAYDASRPTGFPQINPQGHNPLRPCITCHEPHDPSPPEAPHECSGCHAEIARTKAVSHHALLDCTTCHAVPEEHRLKPRLVRAEKPQNRGFCGKCHAREAPGTDAPRINLATHQPKYACWQCHYPHLPEMGP